MKEPADYENQVTDSQPAAPIVELFHMVQSLIPDGQQVAIIPPTTRVADAIEMMNEQRFSQLPVVSGNAVLGVFSYRSLTQTLTELGPIDTDFRELPVDVFMEPFTFVQPINKWESILDHLDQEDVVLLGNRDDLQGILTSMDVLLFLHRLASPFLMLAEIELSLRRIIDDSVSEQELKQCGINSLRGKYQAQEMPASPSEMTFNDYVQIIGDGRNWPFFEPAFGKGNWLRKNTVARLTEVRNLRNDTFHFSRQLEDVDYETLVQHRDWLEMKSRSFEGRLKKPIVETTSDGLEVTGRNLWLNRGTEQTVALADELLRVVQGFDPGLDLKYNKSYIGLAKDGRANNFVIFRPQKRALLMEAHLTKSEITTNKLEESDLDVMDYATRRSNYRIRLTPANLEENREVIVELLKAAFDEYHS